MLKPFAYRLTVIIGLRLLHLLLQEVNVRTGARAQLRVTHILIDN